MKYLEHLDIIPGCKYICEYSVLPFGIKPKFNSLYKAIRYYKKHSKSILKKYNVPSFRIIIFNKKGSNILDDLNFKIRESKEYLRLYPKYRYIHISLDFSEIYQESYSLDYTDFKGVKHSYNFIYDYGYLYGEYNNFDENKLYISFYSKYDRFCKYDIIPFRIDGNNIADQNISLNSEYDKYLGDVVFGYINYFIDSEYCYNGWPKEIIPASTMKIYKGDTNIYET